MRDIAIGRHVSGVAQAAREAGRAGAVLPVAEPRGRKRLAELQLYCTPMPCGVGGRPGGGRAVVGQGVPRHVGRRVYYKYDRYTGGTCPRPRDRPLSARARRPRRPGGRARPPPPVPRCPGSRRSRRRMIRATHSHARRMRCPLSLSLSLFTHRQTSSRAHSTPKHARESAEARHGARRIARIGHPTSPSICSASTQASSSSSLSLPLPNLVQTT